MYVSSLPASTGGEADADGSEVEEEEEETTGATSPPLFLARFFAAARSRVEKKEAGSMARAARYWFPEKGAGEGKGRGGASDRALAGSLREEDERGLRSMDARGKR